MTTSFNTSTLVHRDYGCVASFPCLSLSSLIRSMTRLMQVLLLGTWRKTIQDLVAPPDCRIGHGISESPHSWRRVFRVGHKTCSLGGDLCIGSSIVCLEKYTVDEAVDEE